MMRISTRGRYALRVMVELAQRQDEKPISLRSVAEHQHMTLKYLESIIALLVKERLVTSSRGKSGGYRLNRPASQYTVYEILRATEGGLEPVQCMAEQAAPCPLEQHCPTLPVWKGLNRVVQDYLEGITLESIAELTPGEFSYCDGI